MTALQSAGVPVPGTSALIAASLYAGATHRLNIAAVVLAALAGAVLGNVTGYALGRWGGWRLLERYGHLIRLTPSRLRVGRYLFREHGTRVVFFGRFISGLRTWAAFLAGSARMPAGSFLLFSGLAAVIWVVLNGLGYFYFGHALTNTSALVDALLVAAFLAWTVTLALYLRRRADTIKLAAEAAFADEGAEG
jgi:membrane protein DedA with SNARE-associated domain